MNQNVNEEGLVERLVDNQAEQFSFRDIVSKVFLRPKLFLFALLVPPFVAMLFTMLVPVEWSAATKILIRYSSADNNILKNIVSGNGLGLSGSTSAALIKSTPVLEKTIQNVGITGEDIYKKPTQSIIDSFTSLFRSNNSDTSEQPDPKQALIDKTGLINGFKASLDSSSKKSSSSAIEILDKKSQVPESMKLDELITLQVKSFNREKVDDMANGLASAFIDEYYRIYTDEAASKLKYIETLIAEEEKALQELESAKPADFAKDGALYTSNNRELISRDVPILSSLATQLSGAEAALTKTQQLYAYNSPRVVRMRSEVTKLKFMLKKQERLEASKQVLEQLKTKRYQAQNAKSIYKDRLVPISIVEYADEPPKSSTAKLKKVIVSAVIGTILGFILATSLMIMLNVIDPRVHFKQDVEKLLPHPIVSNIPLLKDNSFFNYHLWRNNKALEQGMWQLITKVGEKASARSGKVIAISSSSSGEGATFCAMALALNLAKNKSHKVCLIDANFINDQLSRVLNVSNKPGLVEALLDGSVEVESVDHLGSVLSLGQHNRKTELGYYADMAAKLMTKLKKQYDFIVIDTGTALGSNEAVIFGKLANEFIVLAASGITRKGMLKTAVNRLEENGAKVTGIVFNQSKQVLPDVVYKML